MSKATPARETQRAKALRRARAIAKAREREGTGK